MRSDSGTGNWKKLNSRGMDFLNLPAIIAKLSSLISWPKKLMKKQCIQGSEGAENLWSLHEKNWWFSSSERIGEIGMSLKNSLCYDKIEEISGEIFKSEFRGDKGSRDKKSLCWERIFSKSFTETKELIYSEKRYYSR